MCSSSAESGVFVSAKVFANNVECVEYKESQLEDATSCWIAIEDGDTITVQSEWATGEVVTQADFVVDGALRDSRISSRRSGGEGSFEFKTGIGGKKGGSLYRGHIKAKTLLKRACSSI